ncbi:hypothetical protein Tco_0536794, partial [Tanacetum coccineum]
ESPFLLSSGSEDTIFDPDIPVFSLEPVIVTTSRYVVPTGRVKVPAGRYVVPTGKDNVIVSTGRTKVIPADQHGNALRKGILEGPYTFYCHNSSMLPATDNSPAVPERTTVETIMNWYPKNKAHFESENEAIHLILTGIGDEIYSTVDSCKTTYEM